ncbi:hypothetical protein Tco_0143795 [Tanacetum coccineum]
MQTAVGVFGGEAYIDNEDSLPLMLANAGNSGRSTISSHNSPPIVTVELYRENLIESDEDVLWKDDVREIKEELSSGGKKFMDCFANCEFRSMVIVDKGMLGTCTSTTDYQGRIPPGPDIQSATVDEKLANDKSISGPRDQDKLFNLLLNGVDNLALHRIGLKVHDEHVRYEWAQIKYSKAVESSLSTCTSRHEWAQIEYSKAAESS